MQGIVLGIAFNPQNNPKGKYDYFPFLYKKVGSESSYSSFTVNIKAAAGAELTLTHNHNAKIVLEIQKVSAGDLLTAFLLVSSRVSEGGQFYQMLTSLGCVVRIILSSSPSSKLCLGFFWGLGRLLVIDVKLGPRTWF